MINQFIIITNFKNIVVSGYNNLKEMIQRLKANGYKIIKVTRY